MSNGNSALALALGAGGGLALSYLLRDDDEGTPASNPGASPTCSLRLDAAGLTADGEAVDIPTAVIRCKAAGRADLVLADDAPSTVYAKLGAAFQQAGILIGQRRNGRGQRRSSRRQASRRYARDGRTILRDGVPVVHLERVDLGNERYAITPHETDVLAQRIVDLLNGSGRARRQSTSAAISSASKHRVFLFRTMPKNGDSRTRFYVADPPTTWEDAKRRIAAAGLLDERVLLPTEWSLVVDPPTPIRIPEDRLRPLP